MKRYFMSLLLATALCQQAGAQKVDSVRRFVDSTISIMEHHSIYAGNVNWQAVRDSAHLLAANATTYMDAGNALLYAFYQLGDKHGWLSIGDSTYHNPYIKHMPSRLNQQTIDVFAKGPKLYNGILENHYAYVSIHHFGSQDIDEINNFAQRIQDSLCKNINGQTRGIIIDLRLNGGGNTFPMLVGVSNVLGKGKYGSAVDNKGHIESDLSMGESGMVIPIRNNGTWNIHLQHTCGDLSRLPVAIIIGPSTASAAEQVAIAFSSRKNTIIIGEPSAGYVTGNNGYELPGFGGLVIAEGYTMNNNGKKFLDNVQPDIEVIGGDDYVNREHDKKYQAAIGWLKTHSIK